MNRIFTKTRCSYCLDTGKAVYGACHCKAGRDLFAKGMKPIERAFNQWRKMMASKAEEWAKKEKERPQLKLWASDEKSCSEWSVNHQGGLYLKLKTPEVTSDLNAGPKDTQDICDWLISIFKDSADIEYKCSEVGTEHQSVRVTDNKLRNAIDLALYTDLPGGFNKSQLREAICGRLGLDVED